MVDYLYILFLEVVVDEMLFPRGPGRPAKRAGAGLAGLSFRVDGRLKNLLLDISEGYDMSMTELLLYMTLKEAGLESLDEFDG